MNVAVNKANLRREEAVEFWGKKREAGQYIAVSYPSVIPIPRRADIVAGDMVRWSPLYNVSRYASPA